MNFSMGDSLTLQDMDLVEKEVQVTGIVHNYLGNSVYMTQSYYEILFGEHKPNGILAHFSDSCKDHNVYADDLARESGCDQFYKNNTGPCGRSFQKHLVWSTVWSYLLPYWLRGLPLWYYLPLQLRISLSVRGELATIKSTRFLRSGSTFICK